MKKVDFNGKRVLIVEENESYLMILRQFVSSLGAKTSILSDWSILDQIVADEKYDLIICDYSLSNAKATKHLAGLKNKYNFDNERFFRTRWIQDEVKDFIKKKRDKLQNKEVNDNKDAKERKNPTLEKLKNIFKKDNDLFPSVTSKILDEKSFLNEEIKAYTYGKGSDYLKIEILEMEEDKFHFSSEDEVAIKEENSIMINFLVVDKEKKEMELSLSGSVIKKENSIFSEVLYDFIPSKKSLGDWKKIFKMRTERQLNVLEQIKLMKN